MKRDHDDHDEPNRPTPKMIDAAEYHAARCASERLQAMIFRAWDRFAALHNVSFEHARILNMNTGIRL